MAKGGFSLMTASNCTNAPFYLSFCFAASRTTALGASVSRFLGPFESHPADPIRRVYFTQLAARTGHRAQGNLWVAPTELPAQTALALPPAHEAHASGSAVPSKRRRKARKVGQKPVKPTV